ncbi:MAG TPA: hypothetical protein H9878_12575, partial [Candidatus Dietzia merdigallinarum]|nr:hypothetical protein [Candidatus Dietzia merdigallinarum]
SGGSAGMQHNHLHRFDSPFQIRVARGGPRASANRARSCESGEQIEVSPARICESGGQIEVSTSARRSWGWSGRAE